jgi:hypothetical protein
MYTASYFVPRDCTTLYRVQSTWYSTCTRDGRGEVLEYWSAMIRTRNTVETYSRSHKIPLEWGAVGAARMPRFDENSNSTAVKISKC